MSEDLCSQRTWIEDHVYICPRMSNLTKQGMADGVRGSAVFVLFLSKGVLERPFSKDLV